MFADNKLLGQFDLVGLPPAPRGIPQIEVGFDIDANGIVNVNAKDLGTGKEQAITLTASSNLSDEEVEKMRKDAESHADDDKKRRDEVETINQADGLIYSTEKSMKDMEGKVDKAKLEPVKKHIDELKKLMEPKEKDIEAIKKKLEEVNKYLQDAATEMYQKAQAEQQKKEEGKKKDKKDEDVVDADYKVEDEKKDKKKK